MRICDSNGDCDIALVTITVDPVNDPPDAQNDADSTTEDTPVDVNVFPNDSDPENDAFEVTTFDATSVNGGTVSCTVG